MHQFNVTTAPCSNYPCHLYHLNGATEAIILVSTLLQNDFTIPIPPCSSCSLCVTSSTLECFSVLITKQYHDLLSRLWLHVRVVPWRKPWFWARHEALTGDGHDHGRNHGVTIFQVRQETHAVQDTVPDSWIPESWFLNPESRFLIPDSWFLFPDSWFLEVTLTPISD